MRFHRPQRRLGGRSLVAGCWIAVVSLGVGDPAILSAQAVKRPDNIGTLWGRAIAAADSGRTEEYRRLMARAATLAPHPGVLYHLARANALTGRATEALSLLERLAAMGLAHFDAADTAFRSLAKRPAFARVSQRLAANRQSIISSDTAFTVPGPDRIPENIAFDSASGTFFLGSLAERTVVRFRPGAPPEPFAGPADGLLRVVGMKVDRSRQRLWVATWAPVVDSARLALGFDTDTRLFAFDLTSGRRILTLVPRDTSRPHLLNDLVITPTGDVYVTDTNEGSVYRIRAGVDTLELAVRPDPARFNYANGIALAGNGTRLYVAFAEGIAGLDLTTGRIRYLTVPPTVTTASVDGLYWHDGDLVAVQMAASVERVVRFVLDPSGWRVLRAEVLERAHPVYRSPTTGTIVRDSLYYVANPGWDRLEDNGNLKPAEVPSPTVILRLPLRRAPSRSGVATQPPQLTGTWTGYWTRAGDTLPVTMVVRRDTTGRPTAAFDSERLRVSGIPFAQLSTEGCCDITLVLRGDRTTSEFKGQLRGDSLTGVFREGTSEGRFAYRRAKPAPPSFDERDITFRTGSVTLAGTLLVPRGQGRVPAVVFMHGSGAEGRWASRYLASQFATRGIASLIFDKRGVGGSSGDWRVAGPDDLAADAVAAVARLVDEPRIDPKRIGIHGHSQGGTLAPMVAVRSRHVAFVIASAAAGLPMDSVEIFSILNSVLPEATTADDSASVKQYVGELVSVAYHSRPRARLDSLVQRFAGRPWFFPPPPADNSYWRFSPVFATYDPITWWRRVRVPVLLVYGADDQRVPAAASAARIEAALRAGGNGRVTVQLHPGADHTFRLRPGPSGWPVTAPNYVQGLLGWVAQLR